LEPFLGFLFLDFFLAFLFNFYFIVYYILFVFHFYFYKISEWLNN